MPRPSTTTAESSIPLPSEQPLEVDYLQNRHRAYEDSQVAYDKKAKEFVAQPLRTRTISWDFDPAKEVGELLVERTDNFRRAVERLKTRKGSKNEHIAKFKFNESENWGDVVKHVSAAQERYSADDSVGGKVRKFFRKVGDNGKSIQSFVGLLPDGEYKTLCGGLTLILTAMVKHSEIREKMMELMDELPEDIVDTEEYIEIYGGSKVLRKLAEQQYVDILLALEYFVEWYMQPTAKHMFDGVVKNSTYGQQIDNQLSAISKSRMKMERTRTRFAHKRLKMMHTLQLQTHGSVLETQEVVVDSREGLRRIEESLEDFKKGGQDVSKELLRAVQAQCDTVNGLRKILADETPNAKWKREVNDEINILLKKAEDKDKEVAEWRSRANDMAYDSKSLTKLLDMSLVSEHGLEDVETVQLRGLDESVEFQLRARWVAQNPEFLDDWYKSKESSIIVVQAHSAFEALSPVSFLATLLQQQLKTDQEVLVLPFFCGLHPGSRFGGGGDSSGPMLLCRALLAQILLIKNIDWRGGNDGFPLLPLASNEVTKLKDRAFSAYLKLLCSLITAMRRKFQAVFLLVDGLDWYDLTWKREVRKVVKRVSKLVASDDAPGVLKVMFSTAAHANGWPGENESAVVLDIPDEIDDEGDSFEHLDTLERE